MLIISVVYICFCVYAHYAGLVRKVPKDSEERDFKFKLNCLHVMMCLSRSLKETKSNFLYLQNSTVGNFYPENKYHGNPVKR